MDIKEVRRHNLEGLIEQFGTIEALAEATNTLANYLSQIRGGTRDMGHGYARKLEAGLTKEKGWMDSLQFGTADQKVEAVETLQILQSLTEADKEAWIKHGRLLAQRGKKGPNNPFGGSGTN